MRKRSGKRSRKRSKKECLKNDGFHSEAPF
jgi:hypothetical protein